MKLTPRETAAPQLRIDVTPSELEGYGTLEAGVMAMLKHPDVMSFSQNFLMQQQLHEILIVCSSTSTERVRRFKLQLLTELLHHHFGALIEFDISEQARDDGKKSRTLLVACSWRRPF